MTANRLRLPLRVSPRVRTGDLDPYDALILLLWPTAGVVAAEAGLTASVCVQRARRDAA